MILEIPQAGLERFFSDVLALKAVLKPAEHTRARETLSSDEWAIDPTSIGRFVGDVGRLRGFFVAPFATDDTIQNTTPSNELSTESMNRLHNEIGRVEEGIGREIRQRLEQCRRAWPEDPRLSSQSLLGPLGLRRREIRITSAIAWCIKPIGNSDALQDALLAATLEQILQEHVAVSDVASWRVQPEYVLESDDGYGRVDIYLEGTLAGRQHCIAIEAKVHAREGKHQLARYQRGLTRREYEEVSNKKRTRVVFLTIDGRQSDSATPMKYSDLLAAWTHPCCQLGSDAAAPFVRLFMADMSRDLTDGHLANGPWDRGTHIPKFFEQQVACL